MTGRLVTFSQATTEPTTSVDDRVGGVVSLDHCVVRTVRVSTAQEPRLYRLYRLSLLLSN